MTDEEFFALDFAHIIHSKHTSSATLRVPPSPAGEGFSQTRFYVTSDARGFGGRSKYSKEHKPLPYDTPAGSLRRVILERSVE